MLLSIFLNRLPAIALRNRREPLDLGVSREGETEAAA